MAYLGNQPVVGDSTNTFKVLDDISTFTLTFDGSSSDVVSVANDTLSIGQHRFITGQKVTYSDGGGAITGLTDGTSYFIIKEDQTTIKLASTASDASNGTAIDLTGLGTGSSHTLNVKFDGTNTKFKATHTNGTKSKISSPAQLSLSVNGVIQNPAVDYSIESDSTIVFNTAPVTTDKIFGTFIGERARVFETENNVIDEFTGDGSSTTFNLSQIPPSSKDIIVTLDGVVQYPHSSTATRSYSAAGSQLVFTTAPDAGVVIQARHIGLAGASSSAVTAFYGREGNVVLTSSDNISVNNITAAGNISVNDITAAGSVSIAGTLTYEDVTNVDSVGLITARDGVSVTGGDIKVGSGITLSPDGDGFYTGVITATSFSGTVPSSSLSGALPALDGSSLTGLASTDNVRTGILDVAGIATFRSNTLVGSGITLSPDGDVFAVGVSTFNGNVLVGSGITLSPDGDGFFSGITTITSGTFGGGVLQENYDDHGALTGTYNHDAHTHGMILRSVTNASASFVINLRGDASTTFGSLFPYPKATTMTIYSPSNNASYYMTAFQIDGSAQTVKWSGGSAPSAGTGSGVDVYSMTILALGSNTYEVYGNFSNFA